MEPESDSERLARRCACLADAREEEAEVCAAMGPSLFPWGSWEKPRHDDTRRSHVLGQFPQGRPTPSPYQTTTPSTSHPNSSSALGDAVYFVEGGQSFKSMSTRVGSFSRRNSAQ